MKKILHLTSAGMEKLQTQLVELAQERERTIDSLKDARELGDLDENSEYISARQALENIENRIAEVRAIISTAKVIKPIKNSKRIVLGSTIELRLSTGKIKVLQVVGTIEADPLNGKISDESPLGKALLGKSKGEEVLIKTPGEAMSCVINSIN